MKSFVILTLVVFALIASCNREQYYAGNNAALKFSTDTVSFDTIFTTIGSATQRLMVYNPYNKILKISGIKLAGGSNSPFSLNIDGVPGNSVSNIEIHPKDSLYIFIQVFVNPTGQNLPLFIRDSILFTVNQSAQNIKLIAYGQDVHLLKNQVLKTQTWPADKPYLIYGNVTVDSLETLTIAQGSTIYFHKLANLLVKGTLVAVGDLPVPIIFQGDRLEKDYNDIPGQWGGIYFRPGSKNNLLNWVIIKNGTTGIQLGDYNDFSKPDLQISNTIIRTMSYNSLFAIDSKIKAVNCVIADAARYSCGLIGGGDYEFYHCTFANYYGLYAGREISSATLKITNYYMDSTNLITNDLVNANFYNSIVYGNNQDELILDQNTKEPAALFQYKFDHCLLRSQSLENSTEAQFDTIIWNKDPAFKFKPNVYLELDTLSPAKDKGSIQIGKLYPLDLKKVDRTADKGPDLGAYERVEK
jgi:hypothetical protein